MFTGIIKIKPIKTENTNAFIMGEVRSLRALGQKKLV